MQMLKDAGDLNVAETVEAVVVMLIEAEGQDEDEEQM